MERRTARPSTNSSSSAVIPARRTGSLPSPRSTTDARRHRALRNLALQALPTRNAAHRIQRAQPSRMPAAPANYLFGVQNSRKALDGRFWPGCSTRNSSPTPLAANEASLRSRIDAAYLPGSLRRLRDHRESGSKAHREITRQRYRLFWRAARSPAGSAARYFSVTARTLLARRRRTRQTQRGTPAAVPRIGPCRRSNCNSFPRSRFMTISRN